jgi:predicted TIM-barrel fold metal-dependent hydrolase
MTNVSQRFVRAVLASWMSFVASIGVADTAPYTGPIMDMHLHAFSVSVQGPPPVAVCVGEAANLAFDASVPWPQALLDLVKHPRCANPFWSPNTDEELRDETIAELNRLNITAVVSGSPERVADYRARAPERVIPALYFNLTQMKYSPADVARLFDQMDFKVLGEITDQYDGLALNDAKLAPFWKFAADRDIPVAVHVGVGPPGAPYVSSGFRARLFSPLGLEDVLVRHPNLRVDIMHAAWPMLEELKAMLYTYPQLYVDTGSLQMALTRTEYYHFLQSLVEAGFLDRVMYGTDQIVWPGLIEEGVRAINDAPFLTTLQKKAILHDNAARFMRLEN